MPYVELEDYVLNVSFEELKDVLVQAADGFSLSQEEVRLKCEAKAESKIRLFLSAKYDLDTEFAKVDPDRNMSLVDVWVKLSLCALYRSVSPDDIPEMRDEDCKEAIDMLAKWRDGELGLPGVPEIEEPTGKPEFIMPIKFISKPYSDPLIFEEDETP